MVRVLSPPHGIDEWMLCRKVDINLNEPDDAVYSLGAEKATLSRQQAQAQKGVVIAANAAQTAALDAYEALEALGYRHEITEEDIEEEVEEDADTD
jgi:LAS superfamily LD-carboxypeptidase LdcB